MATAANQWKKKEEGHELTVPSGNVCLVRRPGPDLFMGSGMVPNSLLGIVMPLLQDAQEKGKEGDSSPVPVEVLEPLQQNIMEDPEKISDMFVMIDSITLKCVIEPALSPVPEQGEERDPERLYIDDIDFEDKIYIFNYAVGGAADLERFRLGTEAVVAGGQGGSEVSQPTEPTAGN